jgi:hypothetical protein
MVGLVLFWLALGAGSAVAQGRWTVEAGTGVEAVDSRDELGSPMAYRGHGVPLVVGVMREAPRWHLRAQAGGFGTGVNGGRLRTANGSEDHQVARSVFVDVSVQATRTMTGDARQRIGLGARISHWTFFRSYQYHPNQIGAVETWDAPVTLDAVGEISVWPLTRLQLHGAFALPVVGRVIRPHYAVRGDERIDLVDGQGELFGTGIWATWPTLQMLQAHLGARLQLHPRWVLSVEGRAGAFALNGTVPTRAVARRFVVGIGLHL